MKITKTKLAAASFGAAMTSLYSAPELSAQITDLVFAPSTVPFNNVTSEMDVNLNAIQLQGATVGSYGPVGFYGGNYDNAAVGAFNNIGGVAIFRALGGFNGGISAFQVVEPGDLFVGAGGAGSPTIMFDATETGVQYVGFVAGGSVGWFSIDLGQPGDDAVFLEGEYDNGAMEIGALGGIIVGNPPTPLLGDVNLDGEVNFLDIVPFIGRLSESEFQLEADINGDGGVDFLDITPFIALLSGGSAPQVTWSDSTGKPLQLLANGNKVIEQQVQAMELKLTNELNAALAQAGSAVPATNETAPASVGLAALALGAAGLRRRRKAVATVA